jgi:hypothetical protein
LPETIFPASCMLYCCYVLKSLELSEVKTRRTQETTIVHDEPQCLQKLKLKELKKACFVLHLSRASALAGVCTKQEGDTALAANCTKQGGEHRSRSRLHEAGRGHCTCSLQLETGRGTLHLQLPTRSREETLHSQTSALSGSNLAKHQSQVTTA